MENFGTSDARARSAADIPAMFNALSSLLAARLRAFGVLISSPGKYISSDLQTSHAGLTPIALAIECNTGILGFTIAPFSYRCIVDLATPTLRAMSSSVMEPLAFFMRLPISITSMCCNTSVS